MRCESMSETCEFLTHLAIKREVAASTQNQALACSSISLQESAQTGLTLAEEHRTGQTTGAYSSRSHESGS